MPNLDKMEQAFARHEAGGVYRSVIEEVEKSLIEKALERSCGNQIVAAKILGLNRNTLRSKIKKLNIRIEQFRRGQDIQKYKVLG